MGHQDAIRFFFNVIVMGTIEFCVLERELICECLPFIVLVNLLVFIVSFSFPGFQVLPTSKSREMGSC